MSRSRENLKKLALTVKTRGRWEWEVPMRASSTKHRMVTNGITNVAEAHSQADARYIAAADPPTVLALLDELDDAEARLAAVLREAADFIRDTSGIGLRTTDYANGWYAALEYALGELYDRAEKHAQADRNAPVSDSRAESGPQEVRP